MESLIEALHGDLSDPEVMPRVVSMCEEIIRDPNRCGDIIQLVNVNEHVAGSLLERWVYRNIDRLSRELKQEIIEVLFILLDAKGVIAKYVCDIITGIVDDDVVPTEFLFASVFEAWRGEQDCELLASLSRAFLRIIEKHSITNELAAAVLDRCLALWNDDTLRNSKLVSRILKIVSVVDRLVSLPFDSLSLFVSKCFLCMSSDCDPDLVYYSARFVRVILGRRRDMTGLIEQFSLLLFQNTTRFRQCDKLQVEILRCIHKFCLNEGLIELFLNCARISEEDLLVFQENPAAFMVNVYSTTNLDKVAPRIYAISLITEIVERNPNVRSSLLKLPPEEVTIRAFAALAKYYVRTDLHEEFHKWIVSALDSPCNSAHEISTRLYLLSKIDSADDVKCRLLDVYFKEDAPVVVLLCCCKLLSSVKILHIDNLIARLLAFIPHCPTSHAFKTLNRLTRVMPQEVSGYSQVVFAVIFAHFRDFIEFESLSCQEIQMDMKIIEILCSVSNFLPIQNLMTFIQHFLSHTTDFDSDISKICRMIVLHQDFFPNEMISLLLASVQLEKSRISSFAKVFMAFISRFPHEFLSMHVSHDLIAMALDNDDLTLKLLDLVAFILQVDHSLDFTITLPEIESLSTRHDLQLGLANIAATLTCTRSIPLNPSVHSVILQGYCVRTYDKFLMRTALGVSPNAELLQALESSHSSALPASLFSLRDYPFPAPVQLLSTSPP